MKKRTSLLWILTLFLAACGGGTETRPATRSLPAVAETFPTATRTLLTAADLTNAFTFDSPLDEAALTPPADAAPPAHVFEGRLELLGEQGGGHIQLLRGEFGLSRHPPDDRRRPAPPDGRDPAQASSRPRNADQLLAAAAHKTKLEIQRLVAAFVNAQGQRCPARTRLEFDHIEAVARGGGSTVPNLRLLCRTHNLLAAERVFGAAFMLGKREAAREARNETRDGCGGVASAAHRAPPQSQMEDAPATVSNGRAEPHERPHEDADAEVLEDAVAALRSLGYREHDARETLARCALPPGATLEQHVRAALARQVTPLLVRSARMAQMVT